MSSRSNAKPNCPEVVATAWAWLADEYITIRLPLKMVKKTIRMNMPTTASDSVKPSSPLTRRVT